MKRIGLIVLIVFIVSGGLFYMMQSYRNSFHREIAKLPQMYCYSDLRGVVNPALFVENEDEIDKLVEHYRLIEENNRATPVIDFPIRTLPQNDPIYIIEYIDTDSLVAEVYSYYKNGVWYSGNIKGYVYSKTLHTKPPSEPEQKQ